LVEHGRPFFLAALLGVEHVTHKKDQGEEHCHPGKSSATGLHSQEILHDFEIRADESAKTPASMPPRELYFTTGF
ncbi:MAG: hypothetical protein ACRD3B_20450, partial [Candidatus Sulfotelmatobacter sp.]